MLLSRKSDTHNHLARRIGKKHSSLHTVTPAAREDEPQQAAADPNRERPFGGFQYEEKAAKSDVGYKSIFGL